MDSSRKINVTRLAFVHYRHPDLENATKFLKDFGLEDGEVQEDRVYFRGYGVDPYVYIAEKDPNKKRSFIGGTWAVNLLEDLILAASKPNASAIEDVTGPGGGRCVHIKDPNGFNVSFVHGQTLRETQKQVTAARFRDGVPSTPNLALHKPRKGEFRRFRPGPSPVHKLGHYGYMLPGIDTYNKTLEFYLSLMNLKPSDAVFDPATNQDKTCFMHIDCGTTYTDHHSLFLAAGPEGRPPHPHHSSFEVNDFDTQSLGHNYLENEGWTNCWGIGRHVLGSQIFDYWFDASGNIIEHYSDGDLVNENTPFTREPEAPDSLYVWGPNIPLAFATGRLEDALAAKGQGKPDLLGTEPDTIRAASATFAISAS